MSVDEYVDGWLDNAMERNTAELLRRRPKGQPPVIEYFAQMHPQAFDRANRELAQAAPKWIRRFAGETMASHLIGVHTRIKQAGLKPVAFRLTREQWDQLLAEVGAAATWHHRFDGLPIEFKD